MAFVPKDGFGALFQAKKKGSENAPDYTGECMINGTQMQIAGWRKTSAKGTAYLSLSIKPDNQRDERKPPPEREPGDDADFPF